jgi:hypothetical protein
MVEKATTAEQMLLDALAILQRGLPPGDLNDRQVVSELWDFDNPQSHTLIERARIRVSNEDHGERH